MQKNEKKTSKNQSEIAACEPKKTLARKWIFAKLEQKISRRKTTPFFPPAFPVSAWLK